MDKMATIGYLIYALQGSAMVLQCPRLATFAFNSIGISNVLNVTRDVGIERRLRSTGVDYAHSRGYWRFMHIAQARKLERVAPDWRLGCMAGTVRCCRCDEPYVLLLVSRWHC